MPNDPLPALHEAIRWNDSFALLEALKSASDLEVTNPDGQTALQHAVDRGRTRLTRLLLQAGANPNARVPDYAWTPLHGAVVWGRSHLVPMLVAAGADLEAREKHGHTPLWVAVAQKQTDSIRALVAAGADLEAQDDNGKTVLWRAVADDWPQGVALLRSLGADATHQCRGQSLQEFAQTPALLRALREAPPSQTPLVGAQEPILTHLSYEPPLEPKRANLPLLSARVGASQTGETTIYIVFQEDCYDTTFGDGKDLFVEGVFWSLEAAQEFIARKKTEEYAGYYRYTGALARLSWDAERFALPDLASEEFECFSQATIYQQLESELARLQ